MLVIINIKRQEVNLYLTNLYFTFTKTEYLLKTKASVETQYNTYNNTHNHTIIQQYLV